MDKIVKTKSHLNLLLICFIKNMDARRVLALWAFVGIKVGGEQR